MKKILTILTSFSLIATSSFLVVACKPAGIKNKAGKLKEESEINFKKENKEKNISESKEEMLQSDQSKSKRKTELDITKFDGGSKSNIGNNILAEIEDEEPIIKESFKWWKDAKKDKRPHFFNPKDSSEILILGYKKEKKNKKEYYRLEEIPKHVKKVPKILPPVVTSLEGAFKNNENQIIDGIETWDTSRVKNMYQTFFKASKFNGDISKWNTSGVTDFGYMFYGASAFKRNLKDWNVSNDPFPVAFARDSGFENDKNLWPPFKNKDKQ
ncbi:BspA family leucine-rich repeat surface protein [Mycoplasma capricolum subsp. capricolum]|uniref:BspA family leucine-rich repeat surface protein n=1 Tax=Mycoplasma capricolum TaxID=2095 RepID=UPI003DA59ABA